MALLRRLLGAFEGQDMAAPTFAARLGRSKQQVYRWERGQDKPPPSIVDKIVDLCLAAGIIVTPEWVERGRGGTAALGELRIPESVLAPEPELPRVRSKQITEADLDREEAEEQQVARKRGKRA